MTTTRVILDKLSSIVPSEGHVEKETYKIGDLAREFGLSLRALRFYEDRCLLSPNRMGSTRLYSPEERNRLKIILLSKRAGFPLVDISELLKLYDAASGEAGQLRTIYEKFSQQLAVLKRQKKELEESIAELESATTELHQLG